MQQLMVPFSCLMALSIISSSASLLSNGKNVCRFYETFTTEVQVREPYQYQRRYTKWCFKVPPRCTYYTMEWAYRNVTKEVKNTRPVLRCCPGYAAAPEARDCSPFCTLPCKHGICTAPDTCTCEAGYQGILCQDTCTRGTWGDSCTNTCDCQNGAFCEPVGGLCHCSSGWKGKRCDQPCEEGSYGLYCSGTCDCNQWSCHHISGHCIIPSTTPEATSSEPSTSSTQVPLAYSTTDMSLSFGDVSTMLPYYTSTVTDTIPKEVSALRPTSIFQITTPRPVTSISPFIEFQEASTYSEGIAKDTSKSVTVNPNSLIFDRAKTNVNENIVLLGGNETDITSFVDVTEEITTEGRFADVKLSTVESTSADDSGWIMPENTKDSDLPIATTINFEPNTILTPVFSSANPFDNAQDKVDVATTELIVSTTVTDSTETLQTTTTNTETLEITTTNTEILETTITNTKAHVVASTGSEFTTTVGITLEESPSTTPSLTSVIPFHTKVQNDKKLTSTAVPDEMLTQKGISEQNFTSKNFATTILPEGEVVNHKNETGSVITSAGEHAEGNVKHELAELVITIVLSVLGAIILLVAAAGFAFARHRKVAQTIQMTDVGVHKFYGESTLPVKTLFNNPTYSNDNFENATTRPDFHTFRSTDEDPFAAELRVSINISNGSTFYNETRSYMLQMHADGVLNIRPLTTSKFVTPNNSDAALQLISTPRPAETSLTFYEQT